MTATIEKVALPPIPAKRYFTIGEVSELCGVKPHVLRYWEQEFTQLKPVKRRGNRRDSRESNRRDTAEAEAALRDVGGSEMIPVDVAQLRGALLEILHSLGG